MPGATQPQHGIQGLSAKLQEFAKRLTSLETWQRFMSVGPSPWTSGSLVNSWANVGSGLETAAYLKDPFGFVHIKGVIAGGGNGTAAFVLPAGFRPGATVFQSLAVSGPNLGSTQILATGSVMIFYVTGPNVGLSGITFLAEN